MNEIEWIELSTLTESPSFIEQLPNEVKFHILDFLELEDKLSLRSMNKNWNQIVLDNLQRESTNFPLVEFFDNLQLCGFTTTFGGRYEDILPLSGFKFHPDKMNVKPFLNEFGVHLRTCSFVFYNLFIELYSFRNQLLETPNLEKLEIFGNLLWDEFKLQKPLTSLSCLKSLTLSPPMARLASEFYRKIQLETLSHWIQLFPRLNELRCTYPLDMEIEETQFADFLHSCAHFRRVSLFMVLYESPFLPPEKPTEVDYPKNAFLELAIHVRRDDVVISDFLTNVASSLIELKLKSRKTTSSPPILPNLVKFSLSFEQFSSTRGSRFPVSHRPHLFPSLRKVSLSHISKSQIPFYFCAFETVDSLSLIDCGIVRDSTNEWHLMFPKIKHLRLKGRLFEGDVEYIATNFQDIVHLSLSTIFLDWMHTHDGMSCNFVNSPVFRTKGWKNGSYQATRLEWAFSPLKKLRRLDVEEPWRYFEKLLTDLSYLTTFKLMQPMKILTITTTPEYFRGGDCLRSLLSSISNANWHGKTIFKIQETLNYPEWF